MFLKKISMKNIEDLFKKVNKESITLPEHKNNLKNYLLSSNYFLKKEKINFSDFKLVFGSVIFSVFILSIIFIYFSSYTKPQEVADINNFEKEMRTSETLNMNKMLNQAINEKETFYNKLTKKDNVMISQKIWQEQEVVVVEVLENNLKTIYYFNKDKNLLLYSEVK